MKKDTERLTADDLAIIAAILALLSDGFDLLALLRAKKEKQE